MMYVIKNAAEILDAIGKALLTYHEIIQAQSELLGADEQSQAVWFGNLYVAHSLTLSELGFDDVAEKFSNIGMKFSEILLVDREASDFNLDEVIKDAWRLSKSYCLPEIKC